MANAYTASTDVNTLPKYYHKVFLDRLSAGPKMLDLCIKKALPQGGGTVIYFPRVLVPSTTVSAYALTQGTIKDTEKVADVQVSATIRQFGNPQAVTDITRLTAIDGFVEEATRALADQANNILDKVIIEEAYGTSSNVPTSMNFSCFAFNTVGKADLGASTSAYSTYVGTEEYAMKAATLRAAKAKLQARNVMPFDDGYFKVVVHSNTAAKLRADSEWQNAFVYTDAESVRKGMNSAYDGVQIIVDNNISKAGVGSASTALYYSIMLGKGGLGATELDGGISFYAINNGPEKADPLNQFSTIGWKANFVPRVLNVSCGLIIVTADN